MVDEDYADPWPDVPFAERIGQCYHIAGLFCADHPMAQLVHGSIKGMGNPRLAHAWALLPDGRAWEPITASTYLPEVFAGFFRAEEHYIYLSEEWRLYAIESGHWGPWDDPADGDLDVLPYRQADLEA